MSGTASTASSNSRGRARLSDSVEGAPSCEFDLAITFDGPQRPIAEQINDLVTAKGYHVAHDAYPEQLWGKDIFVLFDEIYRLKSR